VRHGHECGPRSFRSFARANAHYNHLRPHGERAYQVFYGNVLLATVSLNDGKVRLERVK
jgi:hypothetical protein